jgi:gliding motility-associated-like protein
MYHTLFFKIANMKRHLFRFLSAILTLLLVNDGLFAQNGSFDVRFLLKNLQCADKTISVELQVKAHNAATNFVMGDANYRFEYNPRSIRNPRIAVQTAFSSQSPARDANYGAQNLNGSKFDSLNMKGIVSVNTFYTGGASSGQTVPNNWTTVSEIQFDLINIDSCFELKWHDNNTFPITGMSEVSAISARPYDYNLYLTQAGGIFENLSICPAVQCNKNCVDKTAPQFDCPDTAVLSLAGNILSDNSHIIASAIKEADCNKLKINYLTPLATDDCSTPMVYLIDSTGLQSGSAFGLGTHTLRYRARDLTGKTADCQVVLKILPVQLLAPISTQQQLCGGSSLALSAQTYPNAAYTWTGPQGFVSNHQNVNIQNIKGNQAGKYTISMLSSGCNYSAVMNVGVIDAPVLRNDVDTIAVTSTLRRNVLENDSLIGGQKRTVRLVTQPNAGALIMQSDGRIIYTPSPSFVGTVTYSYEVCYTECSNLCTTANGSITMQDAKRINVPTIPVPNFVTPNGDGINDYLVIDDIDLSNNHSKIVIYNQWGDVVYRASPYKNDWAGLFKSHPLPDGTYYYIFTLESGGAATTGFVTIFR